MSEFKSGIPPTYLELKQERFGTKRFDTILVFGHSPINLKEACHGKGKSLREEAVQGL